MHGEHSYTLLYGDIPIFAVDTCINRVTLYYNYKFTKYLRITRAEQ